MDRGYTSCNALAMAWALPLSVAIAITPAHGSLQSIKGGTTCQQRSEERTQACGAGARRRFVQQAAGWSTFVT